MSDLISRQDAIDAITNCTNCGTPDELRKYVDKHSLENVDVIVYIPKPKKEQRL